MRYHANCAESKIVNTPHRKTSGLRPQPPLERWCSYSRVLNLSFFFMPCLISCARRSRSSSLLFMASSSWCLSPKFRLMPSISLHKTGLANRHCPVFEPHPSPRSILFVSPVTALMRLNRNCTVIEDGEMRSIEPHRPLLLSSLGHRNNKKRASFLNHISTHSFRHSILRSPHSRSTFDRSSLAKAYHCRLP